jgi:hypothetical protein
MISVNGDGSDVSAICIGVSKCPRGTNGAFWAEHGIQYYFNESAWMTSNIFVNLLTEFDQKLKEPAILLLDNFSGHKITEDLHLRHVIPLFLSPNTTSSSQPLDAGIIASIKCRYRTELVRFAVQRIK